MRFVVALASGLETRNQLRKRQEKNEFYFQFQQKKFLDCENEAHVSARKHETVCCKKLRASQTATDSDSLPRTDFAADCLRIPS